jgi:hypothetical protein
MIALAGCQTRPERTPDVTMRLYREPDSSVVMATQLRTGQVYFTRITVIEGK